MKVTMETVEEKGFFSKGWALKAHVEFSEEEKIVIKRAGLDSYHFFDAQQPKISDDGNAYSVARIVQGPVKFFYNDRAACTGHEGRFKEALLLLKEAIQQNAAPTGKKTFEL